MRYRHDRRDSRYRTYPLAVSLAAGSLILASCSSGEQASKNAEQSGNGCPNDPFEVYGQNDWPAEEGLQSAPPANIRSGANYQKADVIGTLSPNVPAEADGWLLLEDIDLPAADSELDEPNPERYKGEVAIRLVNGGFVNSISVRLGETTFDSTGSNRTAEKSSEDIVRDRPDCKIEIE